VSIDVALEFLMNFIYTPLSSRVIFGAGALGRVREEASLLGARALVLSTPEQEGEGRRVLELLGDLGVGLFAQAAMHVPETVVEKALAEVSALKADFTVAIGGGSTTGLAKAISLATGLPSLVIPTTYAGSEVTPIWGITKNGLKTTGRDAKVLPRTVIYDPDLTLSLPASMSVTSGLNAIAHCMEGLYAVDGNPIISLMAEEGLRVLAASLPRIKADPQNKAAREGALYGCWLAGSVLGGASVALHHKLCHTLGGSFDLPHAETHTAVLPHAIAYNAPACPDAMARASRALGAEVPANALFQLGKTLGAEMSLGKLGMPEAGIARAAEIAVQNPYPNPRAVTQEGVAELLQRAWSGSPPQLILLASERA
jgi:alcohol dehydrogenase class IV